MSGKVRFVALGLLVAIAVLGSSGCPRKVPIHLSGETTQSSAR